MKTRLLPFFLIVACFFSQQAFAQPFTNKGKEFWVGYGHHQYMEKGCNGTGGEEQIQNMVLYFSAEQAAVVTVTIDSSGVGGVQSTWWRRTYTIPANTVISTDIIAEGGTPATSWTTIAGSNGPMPKGTPFHGYDSRLITDPPPAGTGGEGLFRKKGIHIESNVPIVAYAHIYGSVSSGATMLMPTHTWGYSYTSVNSQQTNADRSYSWMYVVAKEDFTRVLIKPSQRTRTGINAGQTITVNLMKGQIYQVIGESDCPTGNGVQLTGTTVVSVPGSDGNCHPVAVFSGSSRTAGEAALCGSAGRDNDMQQVFPEQSWGQRYLTAPLSRSSNPAQANQFQSHVYKIVVKDPTTVVKVNGSQLPLVNLIAGKYYQYLSPSADYIEADKPVMVAQFMGGGGTACNGGTGDPEMVILSPIEQASKKVGFFRNTQENIVVNYVTLIVPTPGLPSLRIDNSPTYTHAYAHPNKPGYTVVVKGWVADPSQCIITCDSGFNAITYGLGGAESYAYNAGTNIINLNGISSIHNVLDSTKTVSDFTCRKTPVQLSALVVYQPTQMIWKLSALGSGVTPNADITVNNPVPVGTVVINNSVYYKYTLPGTYVFNNLGSNYIPVIATMPAVSSCTRTEELSLEIVVRESPVTDFTFAQSGACSNQVCFTGPTTAAVGFNAKYWRWSFPTGATDSTKTPCITFPGTGNYNVYHKIITDEGCVGDTTRSIPVVAASANPLVVNSPGPICEGGSTTLTVSGGTTYTWTPATGLSATTGSSVTANPTVTTTYTVTSDISGCSYAKTITVTVNPKPLPPTVTPADTVCQGDNFVLSAAATTGNTLTWYTNAGLTGGSATPPTVSTAAPGTQTYWVTQKTAAGCESNAATITLTVLAPIASNTIGADQQICSGTAPSALTNTGTGLTGGTSTYTFQWQQSTDGGATWTDIAGATSSSYSPPATTGTVKYRRVVASGPCTNTSNVVTITIQGSLSGLNITATPTTVCEGSTPGLIVGEQPTGGDGTFAYTWESSADNVNWSLIAGANGKDYLSPVLTDTIHYRRKVTSGNCSGTSNVVTIIVNPRPAGTITGPSAQCSYDAYSVNFTGTAGTPPYTLILNVTGPGGYTNTVTQNIPTAATTPVMILPTNSTAGNYSISFTSLTDANNCARTAFGTLNFILNGRPTITLSPDVSICAGSNVVLSATGADTYVWSPGTGLSGTTGSSVTASPATSTSYLVTGTKDGCTGTGSVTVTVNPIPAKPTVTTPVTYCQQDGSVPLTAIAAAGHTLTWYSDAALTMPLPSAPTPSTTTAGSTTYYVTQTSTQNCRSAAESITVVVQPSITGNTISADQTVCTGTTPANITSAGSLNGGNGIFAYTWQQSTDGGATWTTISGATTGTLTPASATGVTKYRRLVSSGQCNSTSNIITVTVLAPITNFGIASDQTICESAPVSLLQGQTPSGGNNTYTYQWQSSSDLTTWTNIGGANSIDYQPGILTANTYFRRITTSGPCTATSAHILVTVKPRPNGALTGSSVCEYDAASVTFASSAGMAPYTLQLFVTGPGGYSNTITQSVSSTATIQVLPANSTPGIYQVLISSITDNNGCVRGGGFGSVAVTVKPRPVLTVSPDVPVCEGKSTTLTAGGATTYVWTPATGLNTTTGATVVATPTSNISYVVTGTTNGCSSTGTVTVTVNPVPAKPAVSTPVTYCQNDASVQLSATGAAGNTLTWYDNAALTGGTGTAYTPSTNAAGTFNYYVTQTNSFNCTSQAAEIIVTVQPAISNNNISADQLLCAGSASTPIGSANPPSGGTNTYTYQWQQSTDAGATWNNISGANGLTYNAGTPSTSTQFRRLVTSGMCSSTSNVVTISVQGGVSNIGITGTQSVCYGSVPTLLDGQPAGAVSYQWESSLNNSTWSVIPGATSEDYQPGALTATTYYRRKVSNGACSATSGTVTVTVNGLPMGSITGSTACEYDAASVGFSATEGSAPYTVRLNITGPGGYTNTITQTISSGTATIPVLPANSAPGAYSVAFSSLTDNNGCLRNSGLSGTTINITARPVLNLPTTVPACQGTSTTLTASGATSYAWSPATGLSSTTGSTVTASPSVTTTYTVTGTANGCTSTGNVTVTVNPRPNASFTVDNNVCQNSQATFVPASTSSNVTSWKWDFGDGTGIQTYNDGYSFTRPYSTSNTFNIKMVTVDANGCVSDTARQSITVRPMPSADFTMPTSICLPNGVANFQNQSAISDNSALTYVWDLGDQSSPVTSTHVSHVYAANGPYNVTLTATSTYGCKDVESKLLNSSVFFDKPVAKFSVSPEALCQGMDNVFTDESTAPNSTVTSWRWNFDDGTPVSTTRNPTRRYKNPGTYEVQLVVTNAVGCVSDTAKKEVNVYLQPVVDAGPSFVVTAGTIVNFKPKVNDTTLSFTWTPSSDFPDASKLQQTLVAFKDQTYTLTAVGDEGCTAWDTLVIKILNPIKVPNAFSPNGDGINDTWDIPYLKDYPGATVHIYNRFGQLLHTTYGYGRPWDGTYNGKPLPVATYYYVITLKNGFAPISGSVTIVK